MFSFFKRFFLPKYSSNTRFLLTTVSFVIISCSTLLLLVFASVHGSFSQRFLRQIDYIAPIHTLSLTNDSLNESDWDKSLQKLRHSDLDNRYRFYIHESRPVTITNDEYESNCVLSSLFGDSLTDYLDLINTPQTHQLTSLVTELCNLSDNENYILEHIVLNNQNKQLEIRSIAIDENDGGLHITTKNDSRFIINQNDINTLDNHVKPYLALKGNSPRDKFNQYGKLLKRIEQKHSDIYLFILPTTFFSQVDLIGKLLDLKGFAAHDDQDHTGLVIASFDCGYSTNASTTLYTTKQHFSQLPFLNKTHEKSVDSLDDHNMRLSTYYGNSFMGIGIIPKNVITTTTIQNDIIEYLTHTQTTNMQLEHKLEASIFDEFKQGIHTEMMITQGIASLIIAVSAIILYRLISRFV